MLALARELNHRSRLPRHAEQAVNVLATRLLATGGFCEHDKD